MKLNPFLKWQVIYALLGIAYNLWSLYRVGQGLEGLSSTDPTAGIVVMILYMSSLIPGRMGYHTVYRVLMVVAILLLGYGGVITHIKNLIHAPDLYLNTGTALLAIGINLFGLILNLLGASGKYKS